MRDLSFKALDKVEDKGEDKPEHEEHEGPRSWRRSRHNANPQVQMSVRMLEETYERFRALCLRERRTNGDMLQVMLEAYLLAEKKRSEKA